MGEQSAVSDHRRVDPCLGKLAQQAGDHQQAHREAQEGQGVQQPEEATERGVPHLQPQNLQQAGGQRVQKPVWQNAEARLQ